MTGLLAHIGPVPVEEMLMALPAVGSMLGAMVTSRFVAARRAGGDRDE